MNRSQKTCQASDMRKLGRSDFLLFIHVGTFSERRVKDLFTDS